MIGRLLELFGMIGAGAGAYYTAGLFTSAVDVYSGLFVA